ncbi:carboxypeptidase M32 [Microvirga terrae]|uniref:Metal-dependent carboxypeptidase n=1 Tax=Microvirga terrae TaxID=2740529 RepID=A0ABY5RWS1_9HYPH|nr:MULTISPECIES: carboxypeptidase M32 [Microvirga]MBQ0823421.1 carboxypeptidase M32 [Microvirga sp. HBU67558]UVF21720.1 carboxypeptidase M32 [Microvirga terrae]
MTQQASLAALQERVAAVNDVLNAVSVLTWDSRTMMPTDGAETRGLQIATLTRLARDLLLAPETEKALEEAERATEGFGQDAAERRMVQQTRQAVEHHKRVPVSLIQERAALRTVAQAAWIDARSKSDFAVFSPYLARTIALSRAYADCIGWNEHPYDAMVSIYEPGETAASLKELFTTLRAGLQPILDAARARPQPRSDFLFRDFPEEGQRAFGLSLAERLGYDFRRGRLDTTVHPFEVSFTRNDVRITTRYNRNYLPASIFGTAHETGHGLYEQGVDAAHTRTTLATDLVGLYAVGGTSFGAHESQSRLWENHIVRSQTFWQRHFSDLRKHFPDQLGDVSADEFYRAVTRVEPGFIRVEADELTYDFHIMLRADIECALMDGSLAVDYLPEAWNAAIRRDLDLVVPDDARGVLQDVHWSTGYIGSFPTYTIGNVMGAQVMDTLCGRNPSLGDAITAGHYGILADELRTRIWQHGRRFTRDELLERETGRPLDPGPYLHYLRSKYAA